MSMTNDELYRIALDTRRFEIQMFWQRSNYFLALNTAIAIGFFTLKGAQPFSGVLASLGVAVSLLWWSVTLGGKYWQARWEEAAWRLEEEVAPNAKLFSAAPYEVREEVERSFARGEHSRLQKLMYAMTLKYKPSVSYMMILLAAAFTLFWVGVLVISYIHL